MTHLKHCNQERCSIHCKYQTKQRKEFQKEYFRGFDAGEFALNDAIGLKQSSINVAVHVLKNRIAVKDMDTAKIAMRSIQPRIQPTENDERILSEATKVRNDRWRYRDHISNYRNNYKADMRYLLDKIDRYVVPWGNRAYTARRDGTTDTDYKFEIDVSERPAGVNDRAKSFLVKYKAPKNFVKMFKKSRPFVCLGITPDRVYVETRNELLPLDIHEDPNPTYWRKTRVFADISPRRMGIREAYYIRKNTEIGRKLMAIKHIKQGVHYHCDEADFENWNPFIIVESIPPDAHLAG